MSYTLKLVCIYIYIYIATGVAIDYITIVTICYILVGLVMYFDCFSIVFGVIVIDDGDPIIKLKYCFCF